MSHPSPLKGEGPEVPCKFGAGQAFIPLEMKMHAGFREWVGGIAGVLLFFLLGGGSLASAQLPKVTVRAVAAAGEVLAGDQGVIAVILEHEPGWHVHTHDPKPPKEWGLDAIPTTITASEVAGVQFGPVQWPKEHVIEVDLGGTGKPTAYAVYEGMAIAFVPFIVSTDAAIGRRQIELTVRYQACDDSTCDFAQTETLPVDIEVLPAGSVRSASAGADAKLFLEFDVAVYGKMRAGVIADVKPLEINFFGRTIRVEPSSGWYFFALIAAAVVGGLLLNLTPCVLPVIPIKILSLSQAAGTPGRCFYLGTITSLGVIAFWFVIGGLIAFVSAFKAVNQLFQFPWFVIGVGVFVGVMALGMLGLFAFQLPQWVYRFNPQHGSAAGSFFFGVLTAVLSTPCTAPFMASAMASATKLPTGWVLATFGAIGGGMALPYLVLSAFPGWLAKLPRTGPASELVKQVMGLLMLGVAVFFLGSGLDPMVREPVDPPIRWHWWLVFVCVAVAMAWLVMKTYQITHSTAKRGLWTAGALLLTAFALVTARHFTDRGPIDWVAYTPERFAEATSANKTVVMDFTAEWCLNCKTLEAGVLHRAEIVKLLAQADIVAMKVDLTGNNGPGQAKLKSLEWVGIPLLAVFGPGLAEPLKFDTYTVGTVREAVEKARGDRAADAGMAGSR